MRSLRSSTSAIREATGLAPRLLGQLSGVAFARGSGGILQIAATAIVFRNAAPVDAGKFIAFIAAVRFGEIVISLGLPQHLVSLAGGPTKRLQIQFWSSARVISLVGGGAFLTSLVVGGLAFGNSRWPWIALSAGIGALNWLVASLFMVWRRPATALAFQFVLPAFLLNLGLIAAHGFGVGLDFFRLVLLFAASALFSLLCAARIAWSTAKVSSTHTFSEGVPASQRPGQSWLAFFGLAVLNVGIFALPLQYLESNGDVQELVDFALAQRSLAVVSLLLVALNSLYSPRFATLCARGDLGSMRRQYRATQLLALIAFVPFGLLILIQPRLLLSLLGGGASSPTSVTALLVLAAGQAVSAGAGLSSEFLQMTGHAKLEFRLGSLAAGLMVLVIAAGPPTASTMAIAVAAATVFRNGFGAWFAYSLSSPTNSRRDTYGSNRE